MEDPLWEGCFCRCSIALQQVLYSPVLVLETVWRGSVHRDSLLVIECTESSGAHWTLPSTLWVSTLREACASAVTSSWTCRRLTASVLNVVCLPWKSFFGSFSSLPSSVDAETQSLCWCHCLIEKCIDWFYTVCVWVSHHLVSHLTLSLTFVGNGGLSLVFIMVSVRVAKLW